MTADLPNFRNLPNTAAYLRLKEQVQTTFDFAVVVCHAVPALKRQMSLFEKEVIDSLPDPDYYAPRNRVSQLREQAKGYRSQLASAVFLSCFSFFEAFVKAAIDEMLEFHGGANALEARAENRETTFINRFDEEANKRAQRLRGDFEANKLDRYQKATDELTEMGFRFPSELFSTYGIRMLRHKLGNLRAVGIPDLLTQGLHVPLDEGLIKDYHNIRDVRNRIAHGEPVRLSLKKVGQYNERLRELAYLVDRHLVLHFMIHELD